MGPIATIWINRPHVKNCINPETLDKLGEYARKAEADDDIRAVVFRGRGNTFCAGADLSAGEFGGGDGPPAADHADHALVVGGAATARIQEMHVLLMHLVVERVDAWAAE